MFHVKHRMSWSLRDNRGLAIRLLKGNGTPYPPAIFPQSYPQGYPLRYAPPLQIIRTHTRATMHHPCICACSYTRFDGALYGRRRQCWASQAPSRVEAPPGCGGAERSIVGGVGEPRPRCRHRGVSQPDPSDTCRALRMVSRFRRVSSQRQGLQHCICQFGVQHCHGRRTD